MIKTNKFSQRMNKNKEIILENPFHPLDLSPHDLLAIYKRFEQSRVINRNPKQELPIQIISQLIASLKGCPPSYIQKCISQALIKDTISWNQFLTFLDQQSEVREKILQWLMYEKTVIKYKLDREWPIRSKISSFFEEITFFKYIELGQHDKLILCSIDNLELYLLSEENGKMAIIDSYKNKSERISDEKHKNIEEQLSVGKEPSKLLLKNDSKLRKIANRTNKSQCKQMDKIEKAVNQIMSSAPKMNNLLATSFREEEDDDVFFMKERKNINSLFGIWKDLSLEHSISYAKAVAPKIIEKNINQAHVVQLKQIYSGVAEEKPHEKKIGSGTSGVKPLDRAYMALRDLQRQKRILSYNPYASVKSGLGGEVEVKLRKNTKQRKQRQYAHESSKEAYNQKLRCLAVMYYNMQVVLIKVVRQFSKISLEEQDKIKIVTENQHKKNQIIEGVDFYFHSILNQWFLIVLIRVQYKNELRNQNESYIRGYHINLIPNKRRSDQDYRFASKKEAFVFHISQPGKKKEEGTKHEVFKMEMQMEYGIHFITVGGRYISIKEDYRETSKVSSMHSFTNAGGNKQSEDVYFRFEHEQRFKNAGLSLSCLTVGQQLNKIVFGTIRGMIIIYDMFSHYFKIKKVSNSQITEIKVVGSLLYILTLDEKLIILDLVKIEQIQHVSIKNQAKLHEKVKRFQFHNNILYFYGTEVKSYCQFVNEELQHEQRKMQTMYRWRLDKLFKQESAYRQVDKFKDKAIKRYLPKGAKDLEIIHANVEIVLASDSYFLVLTDILELIVLEKKSLKIKFTMILAIPHDSKVMKMALSPNQKLVALLLFNQQIIIFNVHTQDQYQSIKPAPYIKYTTLTFLDLKNQYLLANGTESGNIMLSPYSAIPEKEPKILQLHKKAITLLTVIKKDFLVSCSEDYLISIWLLPFNILKHEIQVSSGLGYITQQVGISKQFLYLRALEGCIIEINTNQGKMSKTIEGIEDWTAAKVDGCTGQIFGTTKQCVLQKLVRTASGWSRTVKSRIDTSKNEIKEIGIVESQRVVIFVENGLVCSWLYQGQQFGKPFNLSQQ